MKIVKTTQKTKRLLNKEAIIKGTTISEIVRSFIGVQHTSQKKVDNGFYDEKSILFCNRGATHPRRITRTITITETVEVA